MASQLQLSAANLLKSSLQPQTQKLYTHHWQVFTTFLSQHLGKQITLPVSSHTLTLFLTHLHQKQFKHSTILTYTSAISFYHKLLGYTDPSSHYMVNRLLQGIKKNSPPPSHHLPITIPILTKIINNIPFTTPSNYDRSLYKALFLIMYHACLRISDVAVSQTQHVLQLHNLYYSTFPDGSSGYTINFNSYKHSDGSTTRISITPSNTPLCPVTALRQYLQDRPSGEGPIFITISKLPITRLQVVSFLKKCLQQCDLPPHKYSTHAFRTGRCTDLANSKVPDSIIKKLGRWKSDAYHTYVRPTNITVTNPSDPMSSLPLQPGLL